MTRHEHDFSRDSLWSASRRGLCALAVVVGVLGASTFALQQAPDRTKPPALGPPPALRLPLIEKRSLSNGLPVWIVGVHKVPTIHLQLVLRAGSGADPIQKFGLASLTADMLDEGAGTRTALEIADAIDYLGAELSTSSTSDASFVDLHVPIARLGDALPIMADVVARPTFPEAELKRLRDERLASLLQAQDDAERLVQFAFPRLLYGPGHRYGTAEVGTAVSLRGFTVDDLKNFHAAQYRPGTAALVVAGDTTPDGIVPLLEQALGSWTGSASSSPQLSQAPQPTTRRVCGIL